MQGLPLSQEYFFQVGLPEIQRQYPDYASRMAAGLVGDGSECFSFDDQISQDHDWGPSFQIWLTPEDYEAFGVQLQQLYQSLPGEFLGYPARIISDYGSGRVGVFEIGTFYSQFIGYRRPPKTIEEWRRLPEINLAAATNGKVFYDPVGKFTAFRQALLAYYPEKIGRSSYDSCPVRPIQLFAVCQTQRVGCSLLCRGGVYGKIHLYDLLAQ